MGFEHMATTTLRIPARKLTLLLGLGIVLLALASFTGQILHFFIFKSRTFGSYLRIVDLGFEANIPTWYSSLLLFVCSLLLFQISRSVREQSSQYASHWAALSALFLFLSMDEVASLHERSTKPLRQFLGASGFLYYTWVLPGLFLVLVVGLASVKFLLHLDPRTRRRVLVAGCLFVGGSIGMDMVSGAWAGKHGENGLTYLLMSDVEEVLEMTGTLVFIYALLAFLKSSSETTQAAQPAGCSLGRDQMGAQERIDRHGHRMHDRPRSVR